MKRIDHDSKLIRCPGLACDSILTFNNETSLQCDDCGSYFCTSCKEEAHEGCNCLQASLICQKYVSVPSKEKSKDIKKCPKCFMGIQKNGGCDHIACKCGYHFYWSKEPQNLEIKIDQELDINYTNQYLQQLKFQKNDPKNSKEYKEFINISRKARIILKWSECSLKGNLGMYQFYMDELINFTNLLSYSIKSNANFGKLIDISISVKKTIKNIENLEIENEENLLDDDDFIYDVIAFRELKKLQLVDEWFIKLVLRDSKTVLEKARISITQHLNSQYDSNDQSYSIKNNSTNKNDNDHHCRIPFKLSSNITIRSKF